eukprot:m.135316 g.135316  ORF g.135316 m.135316 type:complete len:378 (+) comp20157_c6_seq1:96-1229(+)
MPQSADAVLESTRSTFIFPPPPALKSSPVPAPAESRPQRNSSPTSAEAVQQRERLEQATEEARRRAERVQRAMQRASGEQPPSTASPSTSSGPNDRDGSSPAGSGGSEAFRHRSNTSSVVLGAKVGDEDTVDRNAVGFVAARQRLFGEQAPARRVSFSRSMSSSSAVELKELNHRRLCNEAEDVGRANKTEPLAAKPEILLLRQTPAKPEVPPTDEESSGGPAMIPTRRRNTISGVVNARPRSLCVVKDYGAEDVSEARRKFLEIAEQRARAAEREAFQRAREEEQRQLQLEAQQAEDRRHEKVKQRSSWGVRRTMSLSTVTTAASSKVPAATLSSAQPSGAVPGKKDTKHPNGGSPDSKEQAHKKANFFMRHFRKS